MEMVKFVGVGKKEAAVMEPAGSRELRGQASQGEEASTRSQTPVMERRDAANEIDVEVVRLGECRCQVKMRRLKGKDFRATLPVAFKIFRGRTVELSQMEKGEAAVEILMQVPDVLEFLLSRATGKSVDWIEELTLGDYGKLHGTLIRREESALINFFEELAPLLQGAGRRLGL